MASGTRQGRHLKRKGSSKPREETARSANNGKRQKTASSVAVASKLSPSTSPNEARRALQVCHSNKGSDQTCLFCGSCEDDEKLYGRLLTRYGISVHYFCMLFSSALIQRGLRDEDGILGFLPCDIFKEISRGKKLRCSYCHRPGATIGCVNKKCRRVFHFGCGRKNEALNQYFNSFSTYCGEHRPQQTTPAVPSDRLSFHGTAMATCCLCMGSVESRASNTTLRAPCCSPAAAGGGAWYHRDCVQDMALASGLYFFRCPLCNDKDAFIAEMLHFGVYVPERDAAWESEPDAFAELLDRHNSCDLQPNCLCPRGRTYDREGSPWELVLCMCCGSQGTHRACAGLSPLATGSSAALTRGPSSKSASDLIPPWTCPVCLEVQLKLHGESDRKMRSQKHCKQLPCDRETWSKLTATKTSLVGKENACKVAPDSDMRGNGNDKSMTPPPSLQPVPSRWPQPSACQNDAPPPLMPAIAHPLQPAVVLVAHVIVGDKERSLCGRNGGSGRSGKPARHAGRPCSPLPNARRPRSGTAA